ncbi:MAG: hypothetical protein H0X13_15470 [Ramlibacter sp.]|nr:hypothetical protein [Ramlibacter sp.]
MEDWTAGNPFLGKDNPYLRGQIDSSLGDTVRNYNLSTKPAMESAGVRSGSFGNSGLGEMQGEQQRQLVQTLGNQANAFRAGDYNQQQGMYQWDQGFNRNLFNDQFAQDQQRIQTTMGLLGTQNAFNQQDQNYGKQTQDTPMGYWGQFSEKANSIGQGYGTQTGTQTAQGSPLMGALGGAQLGSAWGKQAGQGQPAVTDGGYSVGQGSAYGGSYDGGMFTPYRAGM